MEFKRKIAGITALCLAFTAGAVVSPRLTRAASVFGDINGDSRVDAKDASIILAYYSYLSTVEGTPLSLEAYLGKGVEDPTGTTTTPAVTTTADTTTTAAATTTTAAATTTEAATATTAPTVDSKYGYYEDLAAEYEKSGAAPYQSNVASVLMINQDETGTRLSGELPRNSRVLYSKGKIGFVLRRSERVQVGKVYKLQYNDSLVTYDINTQKTSIRELPFEGFISNLTYSQIGSKFYAKKYDDASSAGDVLVFDLLDAYNDEGKR